MPDARAFRENVFATTEYLTELGRSVHNKPNPENTQDKGLTCLDLTKQVNCS